MSFNPFSGVSTAPLSKRTESLTTGTYVVEIERCSYETTQNYGDKFFANFVVLESSDAQAHAPGSTRKWSQDAKQKEIFKRAMKAFCIAACGLDAKDPEDVKKWQELEPRTDDILLLAITENKFKGRKLRVDVSPKTSKEGRQYYVYTFSPVK